MPRHLLFVHCSAHTTLPNAEFHADGLDVTPLYYFNAGEGCTVA